MAGTSHPGTAPLVVAAPDSEASLHTWVQGIGGILWQCDAAWRFIFVSQSAEAILGYPLATWLDEPDFWVAHLHPDDRDRAVRQRLDACAERRRIEMEFRMVAADGSEVWLHDVVSFAPGEDVQLHGIMLDVTKHKHAEMALSASEERLRRALGAANIGVFDWHIETNVVVWDGVEAIHGIPEGSFGGTFEAYLEDIHPNDRERVLSSIQAAIARGDDLRLEYRIVRPDGATRWVEGISRAIKDEHGRVVRLAGTCRDVTARHEAREAIRFQAHLLDAIGEAVVATDTNDVIVYWNGAAERLYGWSADEVFGLSMPSVLQPRALEGDLESFTGAVLRGEPAVGEFSCSTRGDGTVLVEVTDTAFRDDNGTIVGMICVGRDIGKRRAAEQALEASERQHRMLVDAFPAMATLVQADGTHVYCNTQWYAYSGFTEADGADGWSRILHPDEREGVLTDWRQSVILGESLEVEARLLRHDGMYRWHLGRTVPVLDADGSVIGILISAVDIHDRKVAEQRISELNAALERRLAELTTVLDVAPVGIAIAEDPDCRVIRANAAAARFLGVRSGANISLSSSPEAPYKLMKDGEVLPAWELPIQRAATHGESTTGDELEVMRADGTTVTVLAFAAPMRNGDGRIIGSVGVFVDISDRSRVERRIAELNAALQRRIVELTTVLDLAPVGIGIAEDPECRVIRANPAFAAMLGVAPYTNTSLSDPELKLPFKVLRAGVEVPPDDLPMQRAAMHGETVTALEFDVVRDDGTTAHLLEYATPMRDGEKRIIGSVGAFIDMTERTHAERSMRFLARAAEVLNASLDYQDTLRQLARIAVPELADWCQVDLVDDDGAIRCLLLSNADPERERRWRERRGSLIRSVDGKTMQARAIRGGRAELISDIANDELCRYSKDEWQAELLKRESLVSAACVPLIARGRVFGAITYVTAESGRRLTEADFALARDVTNRVAIAMDNARLFRDAQQRADDLRTANEAKDEFLGLVSHELRTPITTIFGNAQVLRRREHELDDESRRTAIGDIEQEADRLHRIVENMLTLARVETGREFTTEPVLIRRVIQRLAEAHMLRFPMRTITLDAPDDLAAVLAEPTYLEQVIRNLFSNAEKYSPPAAAIDVRIEHADGYVKVGVLDRGAGIDPDEAEELFTAFYRSRRTSGQASGVGMGLAVCKRLVEAQSGRVWARPREGGGSEIGFALPVVKEVTG